jgi:hypothetical protein
VDWQQSLAARLVIAPGPLLARSGQHCARDTVKHLTAYEVLLDKRLDVPDGKVGRKLREGVKCLIEGQTGWLRSSAGSRHHGKGQTLSTNVWSLRQLSYHKALGLDLPCCLRRFQLARHLAKAAGFRPVMYVTRPILTTPGQKVSLDPSLHHSTSESAPSVHIWI